VTNVREASLWLSYTYLFVRMLRNPLAYGVGWEELTADPRLEGRRYCTAFLLLLLILVLILLILILIIITITIIIIIIITVISSS